MRLEVREATDADVRALADLRVRWWRDRHEGGVVPAGFEDGFAAWWRARGDVVGLLGLAEGVPAGMGFVSFVRRVPQVDQLERHHADVQALYVAPEVRGHGLGARLVTALAEHARARGCLRVTVFAAPRAIPLYLREGFEHSSQLLVAGLDDGSTRGGGA